ncbi:MAG: pyridoxal phosphate-dependent aminotransferase [Deltaproteobacteria bacterium]|nr:pyridoxal phosphate-dependent aminotransferase [Deltaproteobacteria bacterium]
MKLSERTKVIKPSVTLAIAAKAQKLRSQGVDLVNFSAGEPDFDTPEHIKEAAIQALRKGMTKYTDVRGIEPLRAAIAEKYRADYGLSYDKDEILVSCGGKHALYNVFQALLNEGDEVIIPAPYWVSYPDMALLCGAVPKIVATREDNGFRITPEELRAALTPRTRAFVLNSPSNPTGGAYSSQDLEALARVLKTHDCVILSDDIYDKIVYDDFRFHSILAIEPKLRERTVIFNAVSKTYAMTGWRIGYALGPAALIWAAGKIQSQSTSNPTSIAQAAALEAISGPQQNVTEMVREFRRRRDRIVSLLSEIQGVHCFKPHGAFYAFPNFAYYLGRTVNGKKLNSACDLADFFLEEAAVAAVPGEDFGAPHNIRFSYATSLEEVEKGCKRLASALKKLA